MTRALPRRAGHADAMGDMGRPHAMGPWAHGTELPMPWAMRERPMPWDGREGSMPWGCWELPMPWEGPTAHAMGRTGTAHAMGPSPRVPGRDMPQNETWYGTPHAMGGSGMSHRETCLKVRHGILSPYTSTNGTRTGLASPSGSQNFSNPPPENFYNYKSRLKAPVMPYFSGLLASTCSTCNSKTT